MWFQLLLFTCVFTTTKSWILQVDQNHVTIDVSKNVNIRCRHDNHDIESPIIKQMYRIRITKFNGDRNQWDTVAEISEYDTVVKTSLVDATVTGNVDKPENSYIEIHFKMATSETVGQFICEVDGLDASRKMQVIPTKPVIVGEERSVLYAEVYKFLLAMNKEEKGDHLDLKKWMVSMSYAFGNISDRVEKSEVERKQTEVERKQTEKSIFTALANLEDRISKLDTGFTVQITNINNNILTLTSDQHKIKDAIKVLDETDPSTAWPAGQITLMRPDDGCPISATTPWKEFNMKLLTEAGGYKYNESTDAVNLFGDIFQHLKNDHYVSIPMCRTKATGNNFNWPKGSYCYHVYSHDNQNLECPADFTHSWKFYGTYDDQNGDFVVDLDNEDGPSSTYIRYCCREDGKITDPIVLPITQPFILQRYGGGYCQEVVGMAVQYQWIRIRKEKWGGISRNYVFCYYTPKQKD